MLQLDLAPALYPSAVMIKSSCTRSCSTVAPALVLRSLAASSGIARVLSALSIVSASGELPLLQGHRSVAKPEQLAAVGLAAGSLELVQESVEMLSNVAVRGRAGGRVRGHLGTGYRLLTRRRSPSRHVGRLHPDQIPRDGR